MPLTVTYEEADDRRSEHWSIRLNGVEIHTVHGYHDSWEVLDTAQAFIDDELVLWMLHGDNGFLAVVDADRDSSIESDRDDALDVNLANSRYYLGDGVYARFDGWLVSLTSQGESHINKIVLDPKVLANLIRYAATVRTRSGQKES